MKFDKETVIVIAVCMILLLGWSVFYPKWQAKQVPAAGKTEQTAASAAVSSPQTAPPAATAPIVQPVVKPAPAVSDVRPKAYSIATRNTVYYFNSSGVIDEIVLTSQKKTGTDDPISVADFDRFDPLAIDLSGLTVKSVQVKKHSEHSLTVVRRYAGEADITVSQHFTVQENSNVMDCKMSIATGAKNGVTVPYLFVYGGRMAPLKQFANDDLRDIHMLEYRFTGGRAVTVDPGAKDEKFRKGVTDKPLDWIAVSNKYFLSFLSANPVFNAGCVLANPTVQDAAGQTYKMAGIGGIYNNIIVLPDKPFEIAFQYYLGPKILTSMQGLPASAGEAIHLAYWSWFEFLCRPMLRLLNLLKDLTGSYGLAIILLTVLVKLVLWPLIHKGNKSMRRMQRVQPLVKELKEKYKDNQQEFSRRMMELYKKEGVSPFGGCFPMLLQLPIFIALYSTLDSSVELRHVSFLWAQDLSRPDLVGPTIMGIGLHPFIIISTLLMVVQQKLTPPMSDPMQQKMMMLMPVIMLFFFYSFPSGLALYWTVNNVLSILQMKFSQYVAKKEEDELNKSAGNQKT